MPSTFNTEAFLTGLRSLLAPRDLLTNEAEMAPFLTDWRHLFHGEALAVCLPRSTADVAALVRHSAASGVAITPQGGNTSLAAGAIPGEGQPHILLSLSRMNQIITLDRIGMTVTVEAGVIIDTLRTALSEIKRDLPISFAASGSATVGGVLATNAGGANVLRAGMAARRLLGLEVVLADGSVISRLEGLHKDNSGLNWMQLFAGSEGTLGIITKAVLRTDPLARSQATALLCVSDPAAALNLYGLATDLIGERLSAFEIISAEAALRAHETMSVPLPVPAVAGQWLLLVEASSSGSGIEQDFEALMADAFEAGLCADGTLASSETQRQAIWRLRESLSEAEALSGKSVKHDISVPVARVAEFLSFATPVLEQVAAATGATLQPHVFGHIGDGNLHFNILTDLTAGAPALNSAVHDLVTACGGSITAEHGVGSYRLSEAARLLPQAQLDLQRRIKAVLDPEGIFNPGKLIPRNLPSGA